MLVSMRTFMLVAMVAVLLTIGYWMAKPTQQAWPASTTQAATPAAQAAEQTALRKTFTVRIAAPGAKQTQSVFRVTENDDVTIKVFSEQSGTLMLHGFTDSVTVARNGEVEVRFKATHTGRFPLHLHGEGGSHIELAAIEILPR